MKIDVIPESIISPLEVEAMNVLFQFYQMFPQRDDELFVCCPEPCVSVISDP
jgi:hypothetical protein